MQTEKDKKMNEELLDALLKVAAKEALREEMESLPNNEELRKMYPRSIYFDEKVYALINRESKIFRRKNTMQTLTRIASGFIILIVFTSLLLMTVEASRNYILNLLIDIHADHIAFDFGKGNSSLGNGNNELILEHMPNGFTLISRQELDALVTYVFADEKDRQIVIQQHTITDDFLLGIDHEHMRFTTISLNGQEVHLFEAQDKKDHNVLMWTSENNSFSLSSNIDIIELLHIAEKLTAR